MSYSSNSIYGYSTDLLFLSIYFFLSLLTSALPSSYPGLSSSVCLSSTFLSKFSLYHWHALVRYLSLVSRSYSARNRCKDRLPPTRSRDNYLGVILSRSSDRVKDTCTP